MNTLVAACALGYILTNAAAALVGVPMDLPASLVALAALAKCAHVEALE